MSFGVITIAKGDWYVRLAIDLALSLKLHCPNLPRAVVSDQESIEKLKPYYSEVIPIDQNLGSVAGFEQKLCLEQYTPFEKTLYIDCDSLVVRSLDFISELYKEKIIGFVGKYETSGEWYGLSLKKLCEKFNFPYITKVQGGYLYFEKSSEVDQFFERARDFHLNSKQFGMEEWSWRGKNIFSDELALGLALTELNIKPINDFGKTMRFPMGLTKKPEIDILNSICNLKLQAGHYLAKNENSKPAIMHFCTWHNHPIYTRERTKLQLYWKYPFLRPILGPLGYLVERYEKCLTKGK